jgi:hypothetical protein
MAAFGGINEALPSRADVREDFLVAPVAPFPHRGRLIQWKNHSTSHQATDSRFASGPHRWEVRAIFNPVKPILTVLYAGS